MATFQQSLPKWEYKNIAMDDRELEELGLEGWELVSVAYNPKSRIDPLNQNEVYHPLSAFLKRPLEPTKGESGFMEIDHKPW